MADPAVVPVPFAPGIAIGDTVTWSKTISESDVYLFAGITGDFSPNHVNAQHMAATPYGTRIVHGALLIGFTSTASTFMARRSTEMALAVGYDRIRFIKPVYLGDTITVEYTVTEADATRRRTTASVSVSNQSGELCAVATHILQFLPRTP